MKLQVAEGIGEPQKNKWKSNARQNDPNAMEVDGLGKGDYYGKGKGGRGRGRGKGRGRGRMRRAMTVVVLSQEGRLVVVAAFVAVVVVMVRKVNAS